MRGARWVKEGQEHKGRSNDCPPCVVRSLRPTRDNIKGLMCPHIFIPAARFFTRPSGPTGGLGARKEIPGRVEFDCLFVLAIPAILASFLVGHSLYKCGKPFAFYICVVTQLTWPRLDRGCRSSRKPGGTDKPGAADHYIEDFSSSKKIFGKTIHDFTKQINGP